MIVPAPRLFTADDFVVTRPPGRFGRLVLKLARRPQPDRRMWVSDPTGAPIAEVVPVTNPLRKALDGYTRHDVVDPSHGRLLALRQLPRTMRVADAHGDELGVAHHDRREGPTLRSTCYGEGPKGHLPPVIGRLTPVRFGRYELVYGVIEVFAADGTAVARVTNTDGQRNVVALEPGIDRPLRLLTIAVACSLVQPVWLHPPKVRR